MAAFYYGTTKALIAAFGSLFSNIYIVRRKGSSTAGPIVQNIKVPIRYAPRSKWFQQLIDSQRDKQVKVQLPKMAFEITNFSYDASRKKNRGNEITCVDEDGNATAVDVPAPWNIDFTLYLISNNSEDIFQLLEQILPIFNPDITIKLKAGLMNIVSNIPISLTGLSIQDDYEGSYTDTQRLVTYALSFVAKVDYYGGVVSKTVIHDIITDVTRGEETLLGQYEIKYDSSVGAIVKDGWNYRIDLDYTDNMFIEPNSVTSSEETTECQPESLPSEPDWNYVTTFPMVPGALDDNTEDTNNKSNKVTEDSSKLNCGCNN